MIIFSTISQKGKFHGQFIAVADDNPFLHGGDVSYFRGEKMSNLRPRGERVTWGQHKHIHHRWRQENTSALFWLMFTQQNLCGGPAEEPDLVLYVPHLFHSYNVCRMAQIKIQCFYGKSSPWRNAQFRSTSAWQDFNGMNALFYSLNTWKLLLLTHPPWFLILAAGMMSQIIFLVWFTSAIIILSPCKPFLITDMHKPRNDLCQTIN